MQERTDHQTSAEPDEKRWQWFVGIGAIAAAAVSVPFEMWAQSPIGVVHPERLALIALVLLAIGLLPMVTLARTTRRIASVSGTTLVGLIIITRGGPLVSELGYPLALVCYVAIVGSFAIILRRRESDVPVFIVIGLAGLIMLGQPIWTAITERTSFGVDRSVSSSFDTSLELQQTPDVVLVVADAYAGDEAIRSSLGVDTSAKNQALQAAGYDLTESAWSPYPTTKEALPSLLTMDYPVSEGYEIDLATSDALHDMVGGENALVETLANNGYSLTMIESGWSGSGCGPQVDTCVISPFLDEATYFALQNTIVGEFVLQNFGFSFNVGATNAMDWATENMTRLSQNSQPDLIVMHLEIPHPPFFVDADCSFSFADDRSGITFVRTGDDFEKRATAYMDQVACVDSFATDLTHLVADDTVIVVVGDHGTDSNHQLITPAEDWTREDLIERLNVFLAIRANQGCDVAGTEVLPNVFRSLLACLSGEEPVLLEPKLYKYPAIDRHERPLPVVVVDQETTASLVGGR